MTSKTTIKFSPEVRARAVRMVLDHQTAHPSRWVAIVSIAAKIGCTAQTLNEWMKKAEVDSGRKPGLTADLAAKLKALERENRELRHSSKAALYHRRASTCRALADCAKSAPDRDQLLSMGRSWLERAASEDWRDGLPPLPPAHSNALRVVRPH